MQYSSQLEAFNAIMSLFDSNVVLVLFIALIYYVFRCARM
jgi:hypothetical protein